jgi:HlyD family secretion protein
MRDIVSFHGRLALAGLALVMAACGPAPAPGWAGYVEAEQLYLAAPLAGRLQTLDVHAGQQVARGALLFTLDDEPERAARDEAQARVDSARAQAANIDSGKRREELAVTDAQLAQARAQAALARSELAREQQLVDQGFVSKARLDDARSAVAQSAARVAELEAARRVATLPARRDERSAAQAQAEAASQALRASDWRTQQKRQSAPADALVADTFFRPGEYVAAGQPVLALLPPANLKARFFVAEAEVATLAPGQAVTLRCDGCGEPIAARISRIATQAEYTPPVIYSNAQRAKLVFLVEAKPDAKDATRLRPGQPLDVRRAGG